MTGRAPDSFFIPVKSWSIGAAIDTELVASDGPGLAHGAWA
ncbi:hypothetical protein [Amycolatopsis sp. lyj-90]